MFSCMSCFIIDDDIGWVIVFIPYDTNVVILCRFLRGEVFDLVGFKEVGCDCGWFDEYIVLLELVYFMDEKGGWKK